MGCELRDERAVQAILGCFGGLALSPAGGVVCWSDWTGSRGPVQETGGWP